MVIERPSRDDTLMASANLWALRSTCSRAQVGVVIATSDYRPLVSGYNGAPSGMRHCDHSCNCSHEERRQQAIRSGEMFVPGRHQAFCRKDRPCGISVHGEANAIAYAAKEGVCIKNSQLFTTVAPCYACAQLIINSGIVRVVYRQPHRDMSGVELLHEAGVEVIKYRHEARRQGSSLPLDTDMGGDAAE